MPTNHVIYAKYQGQMYASESFEKREDALSCARRLMRNSEVTEIELCGPRMGPFSVDELLEHTFGPNWMIG